MSTLYVVATPIGNLGDLSPRALKVLKEADLILAEDTRVTMKLLSAFDIRAPLQSCHRHNEERSAEQAIARMQQEDLKVALVSDAGSPAVSDPGAHVVALAHQADIEVIVIPGPSAAIAALSKSGFEQTEFAFYGFLPRKKSELLDKLRALKQGPSLAVLYESPHRVKALLEAIHAIYPDSRLSLSRELTKVHEQTMIGTAGELLDRFRQDEGLLRGEFVLVLELPQQAVQTEEPTKRQSLEAELLTLMLDGQTLREAMDALVLQGVKRNAAYAAGLKLRKLAYMLGEREE